MCSRFRIFVFTLGLPLLAFASEPAASNRTPEGTSQEAPVDADVAFSVAEDLLSGDATESSRRSAVRWLRRAVAQDHVPSLVRLANLLRAGGNGIPQDAMESLRLARRAAELGSIEAMADVAAMLLNGSGTQKDPEAALSMFKQAAEKGSIYAADMVGWIYEQGSAGQTDLTAAREWYERAGRGGNVHAMTRLGAMYDEGRGVAKDDGAAFLWYERAARKGDAWSQNRVGWMLRQGLGIERDDEEAVQWFRLSAEQANPVAETNLGFHYLEGRGVAKDYVKAVEHLVTAGRADNDMWLQTLFLQAVFGAPEESHADVKGVLDRVLEDPELMQAPGALPEMCLSALEGPPWLEDSGAAGRLLSAMVRSKRPQAAMSVAWHAFLGHNMPFDLSVAREAARWNEAIMPEQAAYMVAMIDSVAAESPEARQDARAALRRMADAGNGIAAFALAARFATGIGESYDLELARKYFEKSRGAEVESAEFDKFVKQFGKRPSPPTPEELERLKAAKPNITEGDVQPVVLSRVPPIYPFDLRRAGFEGRVVVAMVIDEEGMPTEVHAESASHPLLAESAVEAAKCWRFLPGRKAGRPVKVKMVAPLDFDLTE